MTPAAAWTLCCLLVAAGRGSRADRRRPVRMVNDPNVKVVTAVDHEKICPYVVAVKTFQTGLRRRQIVRCTGTLLAPNLVLTTDYCVRNPLKITVFKLENPKDSKLNTKGVNVNIIEVDQVEKIVLGEGERKQFPNPLFYGDYLRNDFKWAKLYPKAAVRLKNAPLGNVAIVYLESPLYTNLKILFPEITTSNPGKFININNETVVVKATVYGWCEGQIQEKKKYMEPNLTMTTIDVKSCSSSFGTFRLCMDEERHKNMICEMDQGGPVIQQDGDGGGGGDNNTGRPQLLALVNTVKADGVLTYLWPHADWIEMVLRAHASTPTPPPYCLNTTLSEDMTTEDPKDLELIESYYEYKEFDAGNGHKVVAKCGAAAAVVRPLRAGAAAVCAAAALFAVASRSSP